MSSQVSTLTMSPRILHIAMYPWFAVGHLIPFLGLSNKLAHRGHKISFFLPPTTLSKLKSLNLHPDLIQLIPIVFPHVDGLPPGSETTTDIPFHMGSLLVTALHLTKKDIEAALLNLKPDLVMYDFANWMPALTTQLGIKSVHYCVISSATIAYCLVPARNQDKQENENHPPELQLLQKPLGFPDSSIKLRLNEARALASVHQKEFNNGSTFQEVLMMSFARCNAIAFRTCREIEGPYCDYIESQYGKPVLLSGPILPDPPTTPMEDRWDKWLGQFPVGSVVYCSFGTECVLKKDEFQELLLGFELTGFPFFVALKPPEGVATVEAALPEGFEERVKERGVVCGEWVQQQLILKHPSVGCFVTHCGYGSVCEALVSECQLVMLPHKLDQFFHARMMAGDLKVGLEVETSEEDGSFTRESVCKAIKLMMDEESQVSREMKANHAKWRKFLSSEGLESSCIDTFIKKLQEMCST